MFNLLLLGYLSILTVVLLLPYAARMHSPMLGPQPPNNIWAMWLIVFCALIVTIARGGVTMPLALVLMLPLLVRRDPPVIFGAISAAGLFCTVSWWAPFLPPLSNTRAAIFVALALVLPLLPRWLSSAPQPPKLVPATLICLPIGIAAGLFTAPLNAANSAEMAWHHWSAYLAPVEALLAGGIPFRDYPVQYGMGPTLLLASACGQNCWQGLYHVTIIANAIYFASLAGCALLLTEQMVRGMRILSVAAMFCATLLWTGYPIDVVGPMMTPSVGGLRFLTISLLLLHIAYAERSQKRRDVIGHLIWFIDVLWSPETAYFGTLIWWPYLALRGGGALERPILTLSKGALVGMAALTAAVSAALLMFRVNYGIWLPVESLLAYVSNPPGALPANPHGPIWIALVAIVIAAIIMAQHQQSAQTRMLYATVLGLLGAGTYYLSRSHDNNVLNLLPFIVLTLLAGYAVIQASDQQLTKFVDGFVTIMLSAVVAGTAAFGTASWDSAMKNGTAAQIGSGQVIARFVPDTSDRQPILDRDAATALAYLRTRTKGLVVFVNRQGVMPAHAPGASWTSVNSVINFSPLPRPMIEHYIRQSAAVYKKPGWILVENDGFSDWPVMFQTAYRIAEEKRFGGYTAYYMEPR
jgi:hypothetical protein